MVQDWIKIRGARENNLKNVDLEIPKGKLTIFTGVSGSGKSSIVFDTLAQEAGRQLNETYPSFVRLFMPRYRQPEADEISCLSTAIVVDQRRLGGNARSTLGTITDINSLLRLLYSRFATPHLGFANSYSFNDPAGMCPECEGLGKIITLNLDAALDMGKSLNEGAILLPGYTVGSWLWKMYASHGFFDNDKKIRDYTPSEFHKLAYAKAEKVTLQYLDGELNSTYEGLVEKFLNTNIRTDREKSEKGQKKLEKFTKACQCPACHGKRLNETALSSKIMGFSIHDLTGMQVNEMQETLIHFDLPAAKPIVQGICQRLQRLQDIGLEYMNLNRETATLSGGESQRVKMVKHLSSSLTGMMYIFDEPSIGLHPHDVHRLNELLLALRDKGNTVIVVEHDPDVIRIADHIVDVGPKAGADGGQIVYTGSFEGLKSADTLTGRYIDRALSINTGPRTPTEFIRSAPSSLHNLQSVSLRVPKGLFTVVTGVAGSGKSTLVNEVFAVEHPEAIRIDQNPVAANIRSNPATFTGVMDHIRQCFATASGVGAGLFSYNSEGACENCKGIGTVQINLSFMDVMETTCEVCGGNRFKAEALQYLYNGKNIVQVMGMTIAEAVDFFEDKDIRKKLKSVAEVGLDYMTLGQPLNSLSGGECQRLKLARELRKKGNLYILDEPTTGLHMSDVERLLGIIDRLVVSGNTVVVIEHNLDVIRRADWIVDMGPQGGTCGGQILFEGPPMALLGCEGSLTARYLKP